MRYGFGLLVLSLLACCAAPTEDSNGATGDACQSDVDCNGTLSCITQAPAGYCTSGCAPCAENCTADSCETGCIPVGAVLCPEGGRCIVVDLGNGLDVAQCLSTCTNKSDCRDGYSCQVVPESLLSVCLP